jgi:hypothetical protein
MLRIALCPDPEGWEYGIQPLSCEVDTPELENARERSESPEN